MPLISENILVNPKLQRKIEYGKIRDFINVRTVSNPKTPLGSTWKFKSFVMPANYRNYANSIEKFDVLSDDVWVCSFPKSGSTCVQEMVWMISNNIDIDTGRKNSLQSRFPFIELSAILPLDNKVSVNTTDTIAKMRRFESPRFIKSHLPVSLLPNKIWTVKPKIIYVARNPKDVAISYYHHYKVFNGYKGNLNDFLEVFLADLVVYSPFHEHILDYWALKDEENILFLTYEEMQSDLSLVIKKTCEFLNKTLTDEQIEILTQHLSLESMRANPSVNFEEEIKQREIINGNKTNDFEFQLLRKGKIGTFNDEMSKEIIENYDAWTLEKLRDSDFKFEL